MLFTSYGFILFLSIIVLVYYLVPGKIQWLILLLGSWIFYCFSGWPNLLFLAGTALCTYLCALRLSGLKTEEKVRIDDRRAELEKDVRKALRQREKKRQKNVLALGIVLCIGMLAIVKYADFAISNVNAFIGLTGSEHKLSYLNICLPMGISFYVFQSVGYLIDVYRGKVAAERNFLKYALFVSFFPQLVQGPISRFDELAKELYAEHPFERKAFAFGLQRVLWGFFKKLVIADRLLVAVNTIIDAPEEYKGAYVFAGMIFYAAELYCDFTGGIDITIGIAEMLGIRVTENFCRPYFSKSLKEFWKRWHISMGSWFTDYIFYPVSVSGIMLRITSKAGRKLGMAVSKRISVYISCLIVWTATGFWHGAGWNFVVWGLGNCVILLISQELEPFYRWFHKHTKFRDKRWWAAFGVVRTLLIVSLLRLFDCYRSVLLTFRMFGSMIGAKNWNVLADGSLLGLGMSAADYIVVLSGILLVFIISLVQRKEAVRVQISRLSYPLRFVLWFGLFLLVLVFGIYGQGYDATQFIYNQF